MGIQKQFLNFKKIAVFKLSLKISKSSLCSKGNGKVEDKDRKRKNIPSIGKIICEALKQEKNMVASSCKKFNID